MRRSPRQQSAYILAVVLAAAPLSIGLVGALSVHPDLSILGMALAAFLGAGAVVVFGDARDRRPAAVLAFSGVILIVAVFLAGATATLIGDTETFVIWVVAFALGFCCAASYALYTFSRPKAL